MLHGDASSNDAAANFISAFGAMCLEECQQECDGKEPDVVRVPTDPEEHVHHRGSLLWSVRTACWGTARSVAAGA